LGHYGGRVTGSILFPFLLDPRHFFDEPMGSNAPRAYAAVASGQVGVEGLVVRFSKAVVQPVALRGLQSKPSERE